MPCCECCTKKRTAQIFLVLGAALLIASFVIAAALVQIVASALRENAVFPTPNSSRYNDALSNIPSQQKNGDAASTYYSFYFFNITNLDAVVLNKTTAIVDEVGPYIYRSFTTKIDVSFNSDYSRVKYRPWTYRVFQADQSAPLNDLTDTIITVDPLYHTVYGWDGSSLVGVPEVASRITVAASAFSTLALKIFRVLTVQQDGAAGSLPYYTADDNSKFAQVFLANLNLISYKGQAYTGIAPLITSLLRNVSNVPRFTVDMPAVEYRTVVTAVDPSLAASAGFAAIFTPDTASPINPSGSATALSIASSLKCTDMSLANTTAPTTFTCWSLLPQFMANAGVPWTSIWPAMASLVGTGSTITGNQALGIYTWVHVLAGSAPLLYVPAAASAFPALAAAYGTQAQVSAASVFEWAAQRMGHQGINYATGTGTRVTSAAGYPTYPVPLAGAGNPLNAFATTKWNNANMYISRPPRSLAYENANILFGLFPLGRSDDMVSSPFTNYSNQAYAQLYDQFEIDGTGQLNITDVDNIYMFNSYEKLSTGIAKAGKSNFCKNPSTDGYPVQFGFTKATPKYAPGGIGTNPFTMGKSVVEKGLTIDVWSSDISRHIRLGYIGEAKVEGIDVLRYNFSYMELPAVPALNQPYFGVISTYCYQGDNLLTLPHLQAAGVFVDYAGAGTSMFSLGLAKEVTVKYLSNEYLASKNVPPTGDLTDIQPFLDLEPYSGQLVRGSLREQISVYYRNPTGDGVGTSAALGGSFNFAYDMSPAQYTVFPSMWINRYGQLSTKQADTVKAGVYGALTASLVILIIGSILGGVSFIVSFALLVVYTKQDPNSTPYASQSSRADLTA